MPDVAARILRAARRHKNGCLVSLLAPSQKRPSIRVGGAEVKAARVVMAIHVGRPIEADEDVHHAKCRNGRCVEPTHLALITAADHGAERRLEVYPRHAPHPETNGDNTGTTLLQVPRRGQRPLPSAPSAPATH